jgi:hypothetical protein
VWLTGVEEQAHSSFAQLANKCLDSLQHLVIASLQEQLRGEAKVGAQRCHVLCVVCRILQRAARVPAVSDAKRHVSGAQPRGLGVHAAAGHRLGEGFLPRG